MTFPNPANARVMRRYFHYLREADGLADVTINNSGRAIAAFERFTDGQDFHLISSKDAIAWRDKLLSGKGRVAAELSSRATVRSKLLAMQKFVRWLSQQQGFRSRISIADAAYFDLARRDRRIANERRNDEAPSLEQLQFVVRSMAAETDRQKRDRALMAFLMLSGARVSATISFQLKHVMPDRLGVIQDGRDVRTKGGRSFKTYFFPVGADVREIFFEWVDYLRERLLFGKNDPLFPSSEAMAGLSGEPDKLGRRHWKTTDPVRAICRRAFCRAGVKYHPPHTIRRTLAVLGEQMCVNGEELKAWSQNLGHLDVMTTLLSYGTLSDRRQASVMAKLTMGTSADVFEELEQYLLKKGFERRAGGAREIGDGE